MKDSNNSESQAARIAYSIAEVSAMCGKERTWGYRQVKKGRIRPINGFGAALVSAEELRRFLGKYGDTKLCG